MAAQLITVEEATAHLRLDPEIDNAADLELKMGQAEELVLEYVERIDTGWTAENVPLQIKAAILQALGHMWEHRGDEDQGEAKSPNVRSLLKMIRVPVLA